MRFGASVHILIFAALAILSAYGCSPRSQPGSSGNNVILFDDKSGALRGNETTIRAALTSTLITASKALPITDVTITVIPDPQRTISGYGVGAYTPDANTVRIYVDPTFASSAVLPQHLALTLAHELHHAVRWKGPGYGYTLFQAMITEGLADRFCIEVLGAAYVLPPWDNVFPPERTATFLDLARPEFDYGDYDHDKWFFGTDASVPRWTGYTLGFRLVENYQARHPGVTAAQLVSAPASAFRPDSDASR